jgi:endothelin-converting enzyme
VSVRQSHCACLYITRCSLSAREDLYDPVLTYNPLPLENLTSTLTQIHFPDYFASFTPRSFPSRVIITHPLYVSALAEILSDTSSDVIESYLVTRAALSLAPYLGTNTGSWQAVRTLKEKLGGLKKGAVGDRAEFCVEKVESALGFAVGRYFVNETFGQVSREKGTKVVTSEEVCHNFSLRYL